ncbi:MAG TPA: methyltransferase domain-containing protein [Candidatus Saccharimonadales bacterium]|nr:methyltransferase domain-containing protein [Candidatus Saccharimonadales bacterium]
MMRSLCILGRQPAIGLAELESLYGSSKIKPLGTQAVLVDVDPCLLAFDRLGGSLKFCKVLTELETTNWSDIEKFLIEVSPGHAAKLPVGKMRLGLSVYDFKLSPKKLMASGLTIKKAIARSGRSVRLVPNTEPALSSAQVLHNQLTGPLGWELIFIKNGNQTLVAQSIKVQDINSYTLRDRGRPKRDARVGMLPPKLAQIIINLAVGELPDEAKQSVCDIPPDVPIPAPHFVDKVILDPFCGTGVILQEAQLMGYNTYGSDIDERMVNYSKQNLDWLVEKFRLAPTNYFLEQGDASQAQWQHDFTIVASETYLGRPFTSTPNPTILNQTVGEVDLILKKFLLNLRSQTKAGFRICLAVPAWQSSQTFKHLPLLDRLTDMGYNRLSFAHARHEQLIYYRPGQFVGRELVVLIRK